MSSAPNIPEYSVTELANSVRRTLEDAFGLVRVRGEISGFKAYSSGHGYFDLKDADSGIAAVMWKGNLQRLSFRPEDGLEVIATGKISAYPKTSKYQLIVERLEVAGVGALLKQIEDRRRRLEAEGLFDRAAKPRRPFLPTHIGVITSPQGAVIRDILHRLADRFPRRVTLWPVPVQGEGAAQRIAAAINGFNAMPPGNRPDLLIVARGGGSIEDLMPFNEEVVVRAAAASAIPLISAVGHETDTTLIDHASALRAPTPTAAAELAVPVRADLVDTLADFGLRAGRAERRARLLKRERLQAVAVRLPRPAALAGLMRQRLDEASERLPRALGGRARLLRTRLSAQADRLSPRLLVQGVARERARLGSPRVSPNPALLRARLASARAALASGFRLAESLSPQAVLARGFALVRLPDRAIARTAMAAASAPRLQIIFADGEVAARPLPGPVAPKDAPAEHPGSTPPAAPAGQGQGKLF
jgi:exodeoxyribonuclease VII large subunit